MLAELEGSGNDSSTQSSVPELLDEENKEFIEEIEEKQELNEALMNIPDTFEVNGKTVKVKSKTSRQLVLVDKAILSLLKIQYQREKMDIDSDDFWEFLEQSHEDYYTANTDVIFYIINDNYDNPDFDKDWIMDNIDLSEDGVGEQILDSYNKKCSPDNFFQKAMRSRKF